MKQSRPVPREETEVTLPDSSFILQAASSQASAHTTTATNRGNLTMKLLKMKRNKEREMTARRDEALEAMNEMAERRAEEAEAKRREIAIKRAGKAARKRRVEKENKAEETTSKMVASAARKVALQEEKEARAIEAIAAKAEAAMKRREEQEAKGAIALKKKQDQEAKKKQQEDAKRRRAESVCPSAPTRSGCVPKKNRVNMFDEFR